MYSIDFCIHILYNYKYRKGVDMKLNERLKTLRTNAGLSQSKIASLLKTTQASINRYENGQASPPIKVLLWYADFFDVSMDYIFARTDQPQGKLYENKPNLVEAMTKEDKELRNFVNMCFDPDSPISQKLKDVLTEMLQKERE